MNLILSIPMFGLFCMGIYSLILLLRIDNELEARKKHDADSLARYPSTVNQQDIEIEMNRVVPKPENRVDQKELQDEEYVLELLHIDQQAMQNNLCVICFTAEKNSVFVPCGHQCVCHPCGERFFREAKHKVCPICRNRI